jgi:hypothetical protein
MARSSDRKEDEDRDVGKLEEQYSGMVWFLAEKIAIGNGYVNPSRDQIEHYIHEAEINADQGNTRKASGF